MPEEVILERLGHILGGVSVMPAHVEEYDAAHPPPEVSGNLLQVLFWVLALRILFLTSFFFSCRVLVGLLSLR